MLISALLSMAQVVLGFARVLHIVILLLKLLNVLCFVGNSRALSRSMISSGIGCRIPCDVRHPLIADSN